MTRDHLDVLVVPTQIEARAARAIDVGENTIVVWQSGNELRHANFRNNVSVELQLVPFAVVRPIRVAFRWTSRPRNGFVYWKDGGRWLRLGGMWYAYDGYYLTSSKSVWSFK